MSLHLPLTHRARADRDAIATRVRRVLARRYGRAAPWTAGEQRLIAATVDAALAVVVGSFTGTRPLPETLLDACRDIAGAAARHHRPPTEVEDYADVVAVTVQAWLWGLAEPGDHQVLSDAAARLYLAVDQVRAHLRQSYVDRLRLDHTLAVAVADRPGGGADRPGVVAAPDTAPRPAQGPPTEERARSRSAAVEARMLGDAAAVRRLRAPLAALRDEPELVRTLQELYLGDLDRTRTARRLGIARRTLAYRIQRIHALVGLHPTSTRGVQVLGLAAAALRVQPARDRPAGRTDHDPVRVAS